MSRGWGGRQFFDPLVGANKMKHLRKDVGVVYFTVTQRENHLFGFSKQPSSKVATCQVVIPKLIELIFQEFDFRARHFGHLFRIPGATLLRCLFRRVHREDILSGKNDLLCACVSNGEFR